MPTNPTAVVSDEGTADVVMEGDREETDGGKQHDDKTDADDGMHGAYVNESDDNMLSDEAGQRGVDEEQNGKDVGKSQQRIAFSRPDTNGTTSSVDAIDLVLNEIGESAEASTDVQGKKKLTFDGVDVSEKADDKTPSCSDQIYRNKILDTVWLFWNVTTMGWVYGQMGPALPDLQIIGGVQLQQVTWLFTGFAIGYLGGCLLAGIIQDKFNPRLMLFIHTLGNAVTIATLPWLPDFVAMVVVRVANGVFIGGQDTGLHSMLFAIWAKDGGPFIQMTHCLNAFGGIISPLVTQPFVSKPADSNAMVPVSNNVTYNTTTCYNSTSPMPATVAPETNVKYAFLITGILVTSASIPFLVGFLSKRRVTKAVRQYSNDSIDRNKLPKNVKRVILGIVLANSFIATAYIDLFPSFLATFLIEQLGWSQSNSSVLTSVFFATYGIGNFIGVFILAYVTCTKLITFSYITSGVSILGVLLSVIYEHNEAIWVTIATSGIAMSAILPTLFTWTQENVTPITGRMASALLISGSAGVMVNPLLLGYMMELYSPMWFLYLSLGETIMCALLFTSAFILSRVFSATGNIAEERGPSPTEKEISAKTLRDEIAAEAKSKTELYSRGTLFGI